MNVGVVVVVEMQGDRVAEDFGQPMRNNRLAAAADSADSDDEARSYNPIHNRVFTLIEDSTMLDYSPQ